MAARAMCLILTPRFSSKSTQTHSHTTGAQIAPETVDRDNNRLAQLRGESLQFNVCAFEYTYV